MSKSSKNKGVRILLLDIETAPILANVWSIWNQDVGLNQIKKDWNIIAWCAKWLDEPKLFYQDLRNSKDMGSDKKLLSGIWELMNEAQVIITQNGDQFDLKKLNARFLINGYNPPSSYKSIDTKKIAKKKFGFTSNRLEYMTNVTDTKYKKLKHKKYPGHELWTECLKGNKDAWKEMELYNKHDVLALEELYKKFRPWDGSLNYNLYTDTESMVCSCGSEKFHKNGYCYTSVGKYQRYSCASCGAEVRGRNNLFSAEKKASLKVKP